MNKIKPIETRYKGYRFRSRLEARYAVFFDALGVKWEYEKEGYKLPHGCYLPDFWLPEWTVFFEVKPENGITESSRWLAYDLCKITGYGVLISDGLPVLSFQGCAFFWSQLFTDSCSFDGATAVANLYNFENRLSEVEKHAPKANLDYLRHELKIAYKQALGMLDSFAVRAFSYVFTSYPDGSNDNWCVINEFDKYEILMPFGDVSYLDNLYTNEGYSELYFDDEVFSNPYFYSYEMCRDCFEPYQHRAPFVHGEDNDKEYVLGAIGLDVDWDASFWINVEPAIERAKSARFEHGENG